jgi:hypothetical protein
VFVAVVQLIEFNHGNPETQREDPKALAGRTFVARKLLKK